MGNSEQIRQRAFDRADRRLPFQAQPRILESIDGQFRRPQTSCQPFFQLVIFAEEKPAQEVSPGLAHPVPPIGVAAPFPLIIGQNFIPLSVSGDAPGHFTRRRREDDHHNRLR